MAERTDWIVRLSPEIIAELEHATRLVLDRNAGSLARLSASDFPLPSFGDDLRAMRHELLDGRGFVLVRGLDVGRYSPLERAAMFLGIGAHLGSARSQNAKGHVLGHVCDLGRSSADPSARLYQTSQRQTFHTDSCDVVGLLCVRTAKSGGDSLLASALTVYDELHAKHPDLLERLIAPMPHDRRGEVPSGMKPWFEIPVFSWYAEKLTVFYQRQYFDSAQRFEDARRLTEDDVRALDAFDAVANDPRIHLRMTLEPGDMQFVHNHDMLHDRTGFEDWPELDRRRHLLRLWLACPGARPLPEAFAARYGSVEIGNRGGIVVPGTELDVPLEP
jgi:hypothetical protein